MFQWSKKVVKSVTFNSGVADESLLDLVERYLEAQPHKTFSDLCKETLWQALAVPDSVRPGNKMAAPPGVEQQIAVLQSQLADLEERFFAKESNRLDMLERQLMQLNQQVAQLAIMFNQGTIVQPQTQSVQTREVLNTTKSATPPQEVDPVISRISQLVDDF